jgi:hypothetical protein
LECRSGALIGLAVLVGECSGKGVSVCFLGRMFD